MSTSTRYGLLTALILGAASLAGHYAWAEPEILPGTSLEEAGLPLEELRLFTDVLDRVKQDYVEDIDDRTLIRHAIRGILDGLDPHSGYLDQDSFEDLQVGTSGQFGGLGIEVGVEDGFIKVIAPIDDTPAQRAGVQPGDLIIRLDDTPLKGLDLGEAIKLMRGQVGTPITLTIVREGENDPIELTLERDIIQVKSVKGRLLEPGFGYTRITQFQAQTAQNLREELSQLESDTSLKGLILDLRNNPGGVLSSAVEVSDTFLEEGLVVYTEGRGEGAGQRFEATPGDIIDGVPLVVLVNGGSASASEIVAGALQDHRRAVIMGERTFGKGSVQTVLPLTDGTAVKLTTARYFTPNGRSIQAFGIDPDIPLKRFRLSLADTPRVGRLKEADLAGHLENIDALEQVSDIGGPPAENLAESDYQLYEALNLLKGLTLLQNKG